jgi:multiple sugar transport system permease protein
MSMNASDRRLGLVLITPLLLLICGLVLYPFLSNFWMSLLNMSAKNPVGEFVGLANYSRIFTDPSYWDAVRRTILWTVGVVAGQVIIGLGIALLLNQPFKGRGLARSLMILPYTMSTVVIAFIFKWMLNDLYGIVNRTLQAVGLIQEPIIWLGTTNLAMTTSILVAIWQAVPLVVLMMLAGLQAIPPEQYDAARVDGANWFQELWAVTLPGLRSVLEVVVILKTIWTFNWFDLIWLLTQGGPGEGTTILPVLVYQQGFRVLRFSRASAISVTMFACLLILVFVLFRFTRSSEEQ